MLKKIILHSDGSCLGNPGKGGWAAVFSYKGTMKVLYGSSISATNNQMELLAAIRGLSHLREPCEVDLYTDSQYVIKGITDWIPKWQKRGWKTTDGKAVKNIAYWQQLDCARARHRVTWHWVKGHNGDELNELADQYAYRAATEQATQTLEII